jgi:hypothetical protein
VDRQVARRSNDTVPKIRMRPRPSIPATVHVFRPGTLTEGLALAAKYVLWMQIARGKVPHFSAGVAQALEGCRILDKHALPTHIGRTQTQTPAGHAAS